MTDTLALIRSGLDSLRNSEKKVAKCVLADPGAVITSSITELAEKAGTSEPTVIRFCRKLGLGGYMELRLNLARDLPSAQYIFENVSDSDSLAGIAGKILNAHREAISNTLNRLDLDDLEAAVKALRSARRIEFYGVGNSGIVAQDAQHKFFRLGVSATAVSDGHVQVMSATMLREGDCAVVISNSGRSRDLLDVAELVAERLK